jgi:hypothetical protein
VDATGKEIQNTILTLPSPKERVLAALLNSHSISSKNAEPQSPSPWEKDLG